MPYKDRIRLHYRDEPVSGKEEVLVEVIQHPNCTEAIISDCGEKFTITIERELLAEVVGETKVCVTVHPQSFEEEWSFSSDESSSHDHGGGHGHGRQEAQSQGPSHDHKKGKDPSPF